MQDNSTPYPLPRKKSLSGAEKRRRRQARGLPPFTERVAATRKEYDTRRRKRKYDERRALVDSIKLKTGCVDCGFNAHPAALEFDHLPGHIKSGTIAQLVYGATLKNLMIEIAKCEVVCANCHAIRTAQRRILDA